MSKYIDAEILKQRLYDERDVYNEYSDFDRLIIRGYNEVDDIIDDIPAADVRENVKGKWIENHFVDEKGNDYIGSVECDNCGRVLARKENYCPDCGADMRGEN